MRPEFYDRLKEVIRECEEHPYKNTDKYLVPGWEARMSKKNLGEWTDEEYDIIKNHADKQTNEICKASKLDCYVFCDGGGYMYLLIY